MPHQPKQTHHVVTFHHIDDHRGETHLYEIFNEPSRSLTWSKGLTPEEMAEAERLELDLREMFTAAGWEGDGQIDCIFLPPCFVYEGHGHCEEIYHVKQSNNGTSFLAIPWGLILAKKIGEEEPEPDPNQEDVETLVSRVDFPHLRHPAGRWLKGDQREPRFSYRRAVHYADVLRRRGMGDEDIVCLLSDLYWDAVMEIDANRKANPGVKFTKYE